MDFLEQEQRPKPQHCSHAGLAKVAYVYSFVPNRWLWTQVANTGRYFSTPCYLQRGCVPPVSYGSIPGRWGPRRRRSGGPAAAPCRPAP
jgi:hypothetical protein